MSFLDMSSSFLDDLEMKEEVIVVQLKKDSKEIVNSEMIENMGIDGFELEIEYDFWPIQHPTEPSHEDTPVQCPMPHSSHLVNDENDRFSERKRPEASTVVHKESNALEAMGPPIRTFRKRHHDRTNTVTPFLQTPTAHPHLHQDMNAIVFNKFEQVHRFGS